MKARNRAKLAADQELRANNFMFEYLKPVTSAFKIEQWQQSPIGYDYFILYTKMINKNHVRRVVATNNNDYFYLTH